MAVGMSASSVRMEMLIAPVARFAAMKTGNMFKLMAAKICDIGRVKLPDKQAQDTCGRSVVLDVQVARVLQGRLGCTVAIQNKKYAMREMRKVCMYVPTEKYPGQEQGKSQQNVKPCLDEHTRSCCPPETIDGHEEAEHKH